MASWRYNSYLGAKALTNESTSGATLVVVGPDTVDLRLPIMIPLKALSYLVPEPECKTMQLGTVCHYKRPLSHCQRLPDSGVSPW